jgi:hypothetical protein
MREEINTHGGHSGPKAERFLLSKPERAMFCDVRDR